MELRVLLLLLCCPGKRRAGHVRGIPWDALPSPAVLRKGRGGQCRAGAALNIPHQLPNAPSWSHSVGAEL